jgi:hypothetical protein
MNIVKLLDDQIRDGTDHYLDKFSPIVRVMDQFWTAGTKCELNQGCQRNSVGTEIRRNF